MPRSWRIGLFVLIATSRCIFLVESLEQQVCSAKDRLCPENAAYPKLTRLDGVKVGHVQNVELSEGKVHQLITRSLRPLLFEIPDFLNGEECEHIIKLAGKEGLFESTTLEYPEDEEAAVPLSEKEKEENCQHLLGSDEDSNGKISVEEFTMFITKAFGMPLNETDGNAMLQKMNFDVDGDGSISLTECLEGDHGAFDKHMEEVEKNHPRHRTRLSKQAWLTVNGSTDIILRDLQERVILLTRLPRLFIEKSEELQLIIIRERLSEKAHATIPKSIVGSLKCTVLDFSISGKFEKMARDAIEVVYYDKHGHYHAHYDSGREDTSLPCCREGTFNGKCNICRFMTVLYYLNDVTRGGETAFPVADQEYFNETEHEAKGLQNLSTHCYDSNIVVRPKRGTAVMWYNHVINNVTGLLGPMDARSLHGGCDVLEGQKWIANNWINAPFKWTGPT